MAGGGPAPGPSFFASDLHGRPALYERLWRQVRQERPAGLFLGGDLLPGGLGLAGPDPADFLERGLRGPLRHLHAELGAQAPRVFLILGNDDPAALEPPLLEGEAEGLWDYLHLRRRDWGEFAVYGYSCVPPSPFPLKDWERYDVGRYVDPGCTHPFEGLRSVPRPEHELRWGTIQADLEALLGEGSLDRALLLCHAPPHGTALDLAALQGKVVDHAPLDPHIGSVALRRLLDQRPPRFSLHGHVHEAPRLSGRWRQAFGAGLALSAAHDGPELALVRFDPRLPGQAERSLLAP